MSSEQSDENNSSDHSSEQSSEIASNDSSDPDTIPAIDFTVYTHDETAVNLSDFYGKPIVVNFWATWCGPCRMISPIVDEIAAEFEGKAVVGKCNVDDAGDVPSEYGIRNIPTVIFIKDGEVADKHTGVGKLNEYEDKLNALL